MGSLRVAILVSGGPKTPTPPGNLQQAWWGQHLVYPLPSPDCPELQIIKPAAVWCPTQGEAKALNSDIFRNGLATHSGNKGLDAICKDPEVDGLVLIIPPDQQAEILSHIFRSGTGGRKHLFSACAPTLDAALYSQLILIHRQLAAQTSAGSLVPHWSVAAPLRYESAFNKAFMMLQDIGPLLGGNLKASNIVSLTLPPMADAKDQLILLVGNYVALLRKFFGDVLYVQGTASFLAPTESGVSSVVGTMLFTAGASVTLVVSDNVPIPQCELTVWGTLGHVKVSYDSTRSLFEVHRYLKHFEHPSLHNATGQTWAYSGWREAALEGKRDPNVPQETLADMTIARGVVESNGAWVSFLPASIEGVQKNSGLREAALGQRLKEGVVC